MKEYKHMIVCEDNAIVASYDEEFQDIDNWVQPNLVVRVDLEDGDAEFIDVKTLCSLYRKHVLKLTDGPSCMPLNKKIIELYESTDLPQQKPKYKYLIDKTGIHQTDFSAIMRYGRNCGEERYNKIMTALEEYIASK